MKQQLSFLNWKNQRKLCGSGRKGRRGHESLFGGSLLEGRRKSTRPLSTKHAVHLVLKSAGALGSRSLIKPSLARMARRVLLDQAQKTNIKILDYVNTGDQLHLTLKINKREHFAKFSRAATGLIARKAMGSERGAAKNPKLSKSSSSRQPFWEDRPFTRIVNWKVELDTLMRYLEKNHRQAELVMQELYSSVDEHHSSA